MDIKDFFAGNYIQQYQYKSFSPSKINKEWVWTDPQLNTLLSEANLKLGALNAYSLQVPNVDLFREMYVLKEATTSSRIEGTRIEVEEAILKEKDVRPEKKNDWQEVRNYIAAMNFAVEKLVQLPVSTRLLKETLAFLLPGSLDSERIPGKYRTSQNWIGGVTLKDAVFVPPHPEEVKDLMEDLEQFLHNGALHVPPLIRIALAHYQFETIHPFLNGNGRMGRLLITLYLVGERLLSKPTFYPSAYLEKHKGLYYDNLTTARRSNNLTQWVKYFLVMIIETCEDGVKTFQNILRLREEIEGRQILSLGRKVPKAKELMTLLYTSPAVNGVAVSKALKISLPTANALIDDFVGLGILKESTGLKRNRLFVFTEYLNLFQNKE